MRTSRSTAAALVAWITPAAASNAQREASFQRTVDNPPPPSRMIAQLQLDRMRVEVVLILEILDAVLLHVVP